MEKSKKSQPTIIDAKGLILGRMASKIAKLLLNGESIVIVNAEEAVISGKMQAIIRDRERFLQIGHHRKGPIHPRTPEGIVKKVIRGMLPRKKSRGIEAIKRLKVYTGIPEEFKDSSKITLAEVDASNLRCSYIKIADVAYNFGWKE